MRQETRSATDEETKFFEDEVAKQANFKNWKEAGWNVLRRPVVKVKGNTAYGQYEFITNRIDLGIVKQTDSFQVKLKKVPEPTRNISTVILFSVILVIIVSTAVYLSR